MTTGFHLNIECFNLFGEGWEYEVARRLGVQTRSVRRWADGTNPIPDELESFVKFWQRSAKQ